MKPPNQGLGGGQTEKTNTVKRAMSGDPSPLRPFKHEHGRCLGHRPWCHRNQVIAAGDRR